MTATYQERASRGETSLRLACPDCQSPLSLAAAGYLCSSCGRQGVDRDGISSFCPPDFYWGEIPRAEMQAILDSVKERGWEQAVHGELARDYPDRYRYLFSPLRTDWLYVGSVNRRQAALDFGAGWGGVSLQLSRSFEQVVAVEAVWERCQFASLLFEHEGARNAIAVHADMHAPPLPAESFDLVVMNGVLEWAALGGSEPEPEAAQRALLDRAFHLLRPGGSLYIGIENRFALIFLLGGRDHGRPRWMGVLPRLLARQYARLRRLPERQPLTHSVAGYRKLLREAGFEVGGCYAAFPSYSYPRLLVPLSDAARLSWAAKLSLDWRGDGLALGAHVVHRLACRPFVARLACPLAESLVIWARRPGAEGDAGTGMPACSPTRGDSLKEQVLDQLARIWGDLGLGLPPAAGISQEAADPPLRASGRRSAAVLQSSSNWGIGGKVSWFIFSAGSTQPALVARVSRSAGGDNRTAHEHTALVALSRLGPEIADHVPPAVALWQVAGHAVSLQRYVPGDALARSIRGSGAKAAITNAIEACAPFLVHLARRTSDGSYPMRQHPFLVALGDRAESVVAAAGCPASTRDLVESMLALARSAPDEVIPAVAHHGDLNIADILVDGQRLWITDWEWFVSEGIPLLDLMTIAISAAGHAGRRLPAAVTDVVHALVGEAAGPGWSGFPRVRAVAADYCLAVGLADNVRLPLAAAALLHSVLKEQEARYAGSNSASGGLSDTNGRACAARALLVIEALNQGSRRR